MLRGPSLWWYSDTPGHGFEGCGGRALQHPSPLGGQLVATGAGLGVPGGRVSVPSRSSPGVSVPEERRSVGVFPGSRRSAIAMDPGTAGTASAGAGHGSHGGLAPRRAWARAAVGISQEVPAPGGPDGPKPRGRVRALETRPCEPGPRQGRASPGSTDASPALCPGQTWSWAKGQLSWRWRRGGLLRSLLAPFHGVAVGERCRQGQGPRSCAERGALPSVPHGV